MSSGSHCSCTNCLVRADSSQADAILLTASVSCPMMAGFALPEIIIGISTTLIFYNSYFIRKIYSITRVSGWRSYRHFAFKDLRKLRTGWLVGWLISNVVLWQLSHVLFNLNLIGIFVTHFLFGHHLGKLHYSVIQCISVWLSDFSSYSHSCPPEVSTVMWPQQHLEAEEGAWWVTKNGV
jgi:hypothetical protein